VAGEASPTCGSGRQLLAAARTPGAQDVAATNSGRAGAKAVTTGANEAAGLKGALHGSALFGFEVTGVFELTVRIGINAQTNLRTATNRARESGAADTQCVALRQVRSADQKKPDRFRPGLESLGEDA
jgi:hypothetical protein